MNDSRPIDRLIKYLKYRDIIFSKAEKTLSIANGYIANAAKEGRSGAIGSEILAKVSEAFLDLNLIWVITGNQEMLLDNNTNTPPYSDTILDNSQSKSPDIPPQKEVKSVRATVRPSVRATLNLGLPQVVTVDTKGYNTISLVNVKARAGYCTGYGDREFIEKLPSYTLPGFNNGTFRAFEVEGYSMKPTLNHKDIVFAEWVESFEHIKDDRVYVIVTHDGVIIKRVLNRVLKHGHLYCKSDNTEYDPRFIDPSEVIEVWSPKVYLSAQLKSPSDTYRRLNDLEHDIALLKRLNGI